MTARFALAFVTLTGCYGDSDAFIRRAAKLDCVRVRECSKGAFEDAFDGDMSKCRDFVEAEAHAAFGDAEAFGCHYDEDEGRQCIHAAYLNRKDCSDDATAEIFNACQRVMSCADTRAVREDATTIVEVLVAP